MILALLVAAAPVSAPMPAIEAGRAFAADEQKNDQGTAARNSPAQITGACEQPGRYLDVLSSRQPDRRQGGPRRVPLTPSRI